VPKQLKLGEVAPERPDSPSTRVYRALPNKGRPLPERRWISKSDVDKLPSQNQATLRAYLVHDGGHTWFVKECEAVRRALGVEE
jgi:hypothetical protein